MTSERRIGGELEASLDMLGGPSGERPGVWPSFGKEYAIRCDTGRSALKIALQDWAGRSAAGGRVWAPSYVCPSVCAAIDQLGLPMVRYADRPAAAPWASPPQPAQQDIVLLVHYFGVLNRAGLDWLAAQSNRVFSVIEDCVQAPYTLGAGRAGDYAIASLRKWWAAPDGALVCASHALQADGLSPPDEEYVSQRAFAKLARGSHVDDATYLAWVEGSEELLDRSRPRRASWLSQRLLAGIDAEQAQTARRENWRVLAEELGAAGAVAPLFDALPADTTPLAFPVLVAAGLRDALRRFLAGRQIYCPVHWHLPPGTPAADLALSQQILSLPIDQRYGAADMRYIGRCINDFFQKDEA